MQRETLDLREESLPLRELLPLKEKEEAAEEIAEYISSIV